MKRNFHLIGGFGISEKEIKQRKADINKIIDKYYVLGIREFFMGYNPPYWHEIFGFEFSPNGRFGENEQVTSYNTFKEVVEYIHSLKDESGKPCEVLLTVNFWYYSALTMPLIERIIDEAIEIGVDGLIIGNVETLQYLAKIKYTRKINLSTILSLYNIDAISLLIEYAKDNNLNLNRVILPREVTLKEMKEIILHFPEIEFEVFGHGDYCRYSNGLCMSEHKYFSRDLCAFILKHGIEVKKSVIPSFKQMILDEHKSDTEKQNLIDNSLDGISQLLITQNVVGTNSMNPLIDEYITNFENDFFGQYSYQDITEISKKILFRFSVDIKTNVFKYYYDGLLPSTDLHNKYIDKVLRLLELVGRYVDVSSIDQDIFKVKKIRDKAKTYYIEQIRQRGKFGLDTYYKFMLYNRTSVPFYSYFNNLENLKIVKIPLRGRDLSVLRMGLDLIDEAILNPGKFIDEGNLNGKYFHYDGTYLDFYNNKINQILSE
ncbi:MAG: U32 family peptidase [Candidatus Absconditabacteria bacterium]